jgi:hypothetical protein
MATDSTDRLKNAFGQLVLEAFIMLFFILIVFWAVMMVGASGLTHYQDKYFFKSSNARTKNSKEDLVHKVISKF